jgi:hypothetical protein
METSIHDTHSETSETVTRDGTIVAAFNDSLLRDNSPLKLTGWSVSSDGGQTFVDKGVLPIAPFGGDLGDPSLAADLVSGRVYLAVISGNDQQINVFRSDDNGNTFPTAVAGAPGRASDDKEWIAVDNASGAGQGNVYLIMRDFDRGNGIYLFRSTDQGSTFGPSGGAQIVTGGTVQGAWVAVGPDHAVYAFWYDTGRISVRKSTNQGQSFGPTTTVTTLRTTGTNGDLGLGGFRSNAFPQAIVNPANGSIYVIFNDKGTSGDRANVYFTQSNDGGTTWSAPVRVNDGPVGRDAWQPTITVSPNGSKVGIFWYDRRNDPANNLIDRYGDLGFVAGTTVTFGPNFRITDVSFPPVFNVDPGLKPEYMGDYDQALATTDSFGTTWGDNRDPSRGHSGNHSNVRFARIPVAVAGPSVLAINLDNSTFAPVDHFRVTFDESILSDSATPDQFVVTDPSGASVNVSDVSVVPGSNDQQFDVTLDAQTAAGTYSVDIGPGIQDTAGHAMDQDGDGDPVGQDDDGFHGQFTIVGPSVVSTTLTGRIQDSVDHAQVVFNTPIDPSSFSADQFNLTGPDGPVNVTSITPVDDTNLVFNVTFDNQTTLGRYSVTIGPDITDAFGNAMAAPFVSNFMLSSERITNGCFDTGNFMGWTLSGNTQSVRVDTSPVHDPCHHTASLGPPNSEGFLAQRFPTVPGNLYILDYFLQHDGGAPNRFHAMIDGVDIPGSIINNDPAAFDYREFTFTFTAAGDITELKFGFREDPTFFHLDDISVSPTSGAATPSRANPAFVSATPVHAPAAALRTPANLVSVPALPQSPPAAAPAPAHAAEIAEALVALRKSQDAVDGVFAAGLDDASVAWAASAFWGKAGIGG